jgi:hypothetical protein
MSIADNNVSHPKHKESAIVEMIHSEVLHKSLVLSCIHSFIDPLHCPHAHDKAHVTQEQSIVVQISPYSSDPIIDCVVIWVLRQLSIESHIEGVNCNVVYNRIQRCPLLVHLFRKPEIPHNNHMKERADEQETQNLTVVSTLP